MIKNRIIARLSKVEMKETVKNVFNTLKTVDHEKLPDSAVNFNAGGSGCWAKFEIDADPTTAFDLLRKLGFKNKKLLPGSRTPSGVEKAQGGSFVYVTAVKKGQKTSVTVIVHSSGE